MAHIDLRVQPFHLITADTAAWVQALPIEQGKVRAHRLFRGDGVTAMGVAMDAGAVMKDHAAAAPILVHVVDGEVRFDIAGESLRLPAGALVHVQPGERHEVAAIERSRFLLLVLDGHRP